MCVCMCVCYRTQTRCFPITTTVSDTASQPEGFVPCCDLLGTACTGHILHQGICITNLGSQAPKHVCNLTASFDEHLYTHSLTTTKHKIHSTLS